MPIVTELIQENWQANWLGFSWLPAVMFWLQLTGWIFACNIFCSECTRGGFCNFMHLKPISRELRRELYSRVRHGKRWVDVLVVCYLTATRAKDVFLYLTYTDANWCWKSSVQPSALIICKILKLVWISVPGWNETCIVLLFFIFCHRSRSRSPNHRSRNHDHRRRSRSRSPHRRSRSQERSGRF